ncbi:hypothetical protein DPMN_109582 [Dreissena polymorpha]|uniref:Sushi domain-containing protein n=1 Tax=Dreissena polymorpha TaxID=45954 RepID=A0A9D4KAI5_DREPO|nr:hypothetical protein DPMN_109582 [Dreissena polymorpha]
MVKINVGFCVIILNISYIVILAADCGALVAPVSGTVVYTVSTYGSIAGYQCNQCYQCNTGYDMVGNGPRDCLSNATWSGQPPVCQIKGI